MMKTSELTGAALDWAVAKCELGEPVGSFLDGVVPNPDYARFYPSTNWAQGGPIIERERIDLFTEKDYPESWLASVARYQNGKRLVGLRLHRYGPTPLIAAMRCYVASKMGDEIEIPEELNGKV